MQMQKFALALLLGAGVVENPSRVVTIDSGCKQLRKSRV